MKASISTLLLTIFTCSFLFAQEGDTRIRILNADRTRMDKAVAEDLQMLVGHVRFQHEDAIMTCDSAVFSQAENMFRAYDNVRIDQGDTLTLTSEYLDYVGDSKIANIQGNVIMRNKGITLTTDSLVYDRGKQIAYYPYKGTIVDSANVLKSIRGTYYVNEDKAHFIRDVELTNPKYVINSQSMVYYTKSRTTYFYSETVITSDENKIYTDRGVYNTDSGIAYFTKNSRIHSNGQIMKGDSLYYDRSIGFGSATEHVKIIDTVKNIVIDGGYAEVHEKEDSVFIVKDPVAHYLMQEDTLHMRADTLMMTLLPGVDSSRILRAFHEVRFFKSDMSGKCDSIFSNESTGLMEMHVDPIIWSGPNQMTSDTIHITRKLPGGDLDSLRMLKNAFIISMDNDSVSFNQIKGKDIKGKFKNNDLHKVQVLGNAQTLYYAEDEKENRIGVNKAEASYMLIHMINNQISRVSYIEKPDATLYREDELPDNARKLKNFVWRDEERIRSKADIYKVEGYSPAYAFDQVAARGHLTDILDTLRAPKLKMMIKDALAQEDLQKYIRRMEDPDDKALLMAMAQGENYRKILEAPVIVQEKESFLEAFKEDIMNASEQIDDQIIKAQLETILIENSFEDAYKKVLEIPGLEDNKQIQEVLMKYGAEGLEEAISDPDAIQEILKEKGKDVKLKSLMDQTGL